MPANPTIGSDFDPIPAPSWSRIVLLLVAFTALGALLALCGSA